MRKEKFEEVFKGRKLSFRKVLLDIKDSERQPRDRETAYAYTIRITKNSRVGTIEMFYAKMRAIIDILTKGRTHKNLLATKKEILGEPEEHVRDIAYELY